MLDSFQINGVSDPTQCEICHQGEYLEPGKNVCTRCISSGIQRQIEEDHRKIAKQKILELSAKNQTLEKEKRDKRIIKAKEEETRTRQKDFRASLSIEAQRYFTIDPSKNILSIAELTTLFEMLKKKHIRYIVLVKSIDIVCSGSLILYWIYQLHLGLGIFDKALNIRLGMVLSTPVVLIYAVLRSIMYYVTKNPYLYRIEIHNIYKNYKWLRKRGFTDEDLLAPFVKKEGDKNDIGSKTGSEL
jgi:hypothetical protein